MKNVFLLLLLLTALLEAKVFVREYTYNASENDSKVSARKAALRQLQLLLIEEVGITVRSRYFKNERLKNNEVQKTIDAKYESFSQAITKSKILKESWDGETFYVKVEMDIDPKGVAQAIDLIQNPAKSEMERCKIKEAAVQTSLKDLASSQKIDALIADAIKYPFTLPCNRWHFDIIYKFIRYDIYHSGYRDFLVQNLAKIALPAEDNRIFYIVDYINHNKGLTKAEWKIVLGALQKMTASRIRNILSTIFSKPNTNTEEYLDQFLALAKEGKVGLPKAMEFSKILTKTISVLRQQESMLFEKYYEQYNTILSPKEDKELFLTLQSRYYKVPTQRRLEMIVEYFKRQKPSKYVSDNLFDMFKRLEREAKKSGVFEKDFKFLVSKTHDVMNESFPLCQYRSGQQDRIQFMLRFGIDSRMIPTAEQSAKMIFSKDESEQIEHSQYLELMGKSAKNVEEKIIKRLRRMEHASFRGSVTMQWHLMGALAAMKTDNLEAQALLIRALSSKGYRVPDYAEIALKNLDKNIVKLLIEAYKGKQTYIQIRLIRILGSFKTMDPSVIVFLKSIKDPNSWIKDAVEDALEV